MTRPSSSSTPLRALTGVIGTAALVLTISALGASDEASARTTAAYSDGFERPTIGSKLRRSGRPTLQRGVRNSGRSALKTPRRRGAHFVARRIPNSLQVRVDISYRRTRAGKHGVIRLAKNKIELVDDGKRLHLVTKGRSRPIGPRHRSVGRWVRIAMVLDGKGGRVIIGRNRKKIATIKTGIRKEHTVVVGTRDGRRGPAYYDRLRVLTGKRAQPKPLPTNGGGSPAPRPGSPAPGGLQPAPGAPAIGGIPDGSRFFAPGSFLNKPLPPTALLDSKSAQLSNDLQRQLGLGVPWINHDQWSVPVYTVGKNHRKVKVSLDASYKDPAVLRAFAAVPIPPNALPARGTDSHLVVWQPETDTMWEFFAITGSGDNWTAKHGGKAENVSKHNGVLPWPQGGTATGISLMAGLITLDELEAGKIEHALALAIPEPRQEFFSSPANRTDGHVPGAGIVPEGARFRLPPNLDLSGLPRPTRVLAEAIQKYGMVVRDHSGVVSFYAEDPRPSGRAAVYNRFFGGMTTDQVVKALPWDKMQLLKTDMHCCWNIDAARRAGN